MKDKKVLGLNIIKKYYNRLNSRLNFTERTLRIFAGILLPIILINITLHYLTGTLNFLNTHHYDGMLFNSDALLLPALFTDIFEKGGNLSDWILSPAPYFFPDYPMFLLAYFNAPDTYWQILLFALIQMTITFLAIWLLVKQIIQNNCFFFATVLFLFFTWLALQNIQPLVFIFVNSFHYGTFIMTILVISLWLIINTKNINKNKVFYYLLLLIIAFITTLSDSIFLMWCIAPLVATQWILTFINRDFSFKKTFLLIGVIISSLLGLKGYRWIVPNPVSARRNIKLHFDNILYFDNIYEPISKILTQMPILGFLLVLGFCIILYFLIHIFRYKKTNYTLFWVTLFFCLSICTIISIVMLSDILWLPRYLTPLFYLPVIVILLFLQRTYNKQIIPICILFCLIFTLHMSVSSYLSIKKKGIKTEYYPENIACIDSILAKEKLNTGITGFWKTNVIQNFSKLNLNLATHNFNTMYEYHWLTSKKYFKSKYDFVIIRKSHKNNVSIIKKLQQINENSYPHIEDCGDLWVYIYGKDKLKIYE